MVARWVVARGVLARWVVRCSAVAACALVAGVLPVLPVLPVPAGAASTPTDAATPSAGTDEEGAVEPTDPALPETPPDPLQVTIQSLTPAAVPEEGPVEVSGRITNRSEDQWTDLNVYLVTSYEPITSAAALQDAATSDARSSAGTRVVEPGTYVQVDDLAPGESTRYELSVPRSLLGISGAPGVYWLGVHVLGTESGVRIDDADGRVRTFLPLVPDEATTPVAVALQVRADAARDGDGRLLDLPAWQQLLRPDGRLGRLLALTSRAGDAPVDWVVDPAVPVAARAVGAGDPPLDVEATLADPEPVDPVDPAVTLAPEPGDEDAEDPPAEEPSDGEPTDQPTDEPEDPAAEPDDRDSRAARDWLQRFVRLAGGREVLAVPYGGLDVAAAVSQQRTGLVTRAHDTGLRVLGGLGVDASPVVAPPGGLLPPTGVLAVDPAVPVLLAPDAVPALAAQPVVARPEGGVLAFAAGRRAVRGPAPGRAEGAIAVRQRILADAALHALSPDAAKPFVRLLPPRWDPGPRWRQSRFFRSLDQPWTVPVPLSQVLRGDPGADPATVIDPADVRYPDSEAAAEVPVTTMLATEAAVDAGRTLAQVLSEGSDVDERVTRLALLAPSVWSRTRPILAAARARELAVLVGDWLGRIEVRGPPFVTLSSETGTLFVTLVNGLDQPVTVGIAADVAGTGLQLGRTEAMELAPRSRVPVRIDAATQDLGVYRVTLQPVTEAGSPVGVPSTVSVRASNVGLILWLVMGGGSAVLLLVIAFRIWRRVVQRQASAEPRLRAPAA